MATEGNQALPQVFLRNLQVPLRVLSLVPVGTVEKYQVAAFEVNGESLKLAIVYPEQLKQGFYTALDDIGKKIGRKVELFRTDAASMQSLLKQYRDQLAGPPKLPEPAPQVAVALAPQAPKSLPVPPQYVKPPLFELGKTIAYNYLKRIPVEFSKQHRMLCVDYLAPNQYWILTDQTDNPLTAGLVKGLEERNHITVNLIPAAPSDVDGLLSYYVRLAKDEQVKVEAAAKAAAETRVVPAITVLGAANEGVETKKAEIPTETKLGVKEMLELAKEAPPTPKPPVPSPSAPATEDDMVIPDAQATILSSGNEQGGFAGFFQRMSQGMTTKSEAEPVTPVTPVPPLAIQPVANPAPVAAPAPAPPPVEKAPPAPAIQVKSDEDGDIGKLLEGNIETLDGLKELVKKGSIPRIVAGIVNFAIHEKASDVHVEAFADEVVVRYRVDGQLAEVIKMPADLHAAVVSRIKILAKLRLDETRVPQDGRFEVNFSSVQVDLRVSILPTVHGEKVVMRILDKNRGITSLESLGIVGLAYENIFKSIQRPFGVCLATGPTGSGKSTSLYAILKQIATPNVNVSTLEDPVEYEMSGINQSQIRPKIGFTFAEGLRSLLRQDPNIIMVGEIRDGETANMATQAALTGHLVLSTLHTNDAAGAIPRLENMGIEPFLITSSLNMVIGQRLVRKICQNCKSEVSLPEGVRAKFVADIEKIRSINPTDAGRIKEPMVFYQGTGCDVCRGKGYEGRIGIYEVLVMSEAIEKMALDRAPGTKIAEQSQSEGMLTMYQDGLLKVLAGLTTLDEVLRETSNK